MKTYIVDKTSGILHENRPGWAERIGVFLYEDGDDITKLEGECPLLFSNVDNFETFVREHPDDFSSWVNDDNLTVVIRKFKTI